MPEGIEGHLPVQAQTVSGTVTASAGTNLDTSGLAKEAGGNLAVVAAATASTATNTGSIATNTSTTATNTGTIVTSVATIATNTGRIPAQGQAAMAASLPVVLANNQTAVPVSGTFYQATQPVSAAALPLPTGAALESGGNLATLVARTPATGSATSANSSPVVVASDQAAIPTKGSFTEFAGLTAGALNVDLLPSTDSAGYSWFSLHLTALAVGGTIVVQGCNDNATWVNVVQENIAGSAGTVSSGIAGTGIYHGFLPYRYLRMRQTAWTSGTSTGVVELFTVPRPWSFMGVSALQNGVWTAVPNAGTAGGATPFKVISAASTNATSLKASAGQLYGAIAGNTTTTWKFVKFYNKASAPTVGTDVPVFTLPVPPNGCAPYPSQVGIAYGTGIAYAITGAAADNDNTAVAAGDVILSGEFK